VSRSRLTSVESHNPVSYRQTDRHTYRQTKRQADTQLRCRTASHLPPPTRGTEVYNDQTGTRDQNSGGGLGIERFGLSLSLARLKRLDPRGL